MGTEQARPKSITIYPEEEAVVTAVADRLFEGNTSQAIRWIIRQYARMAAETVTMPASDNGK